MTKYEGFSGLCFPVVRLNIGKYGPERPPYLETFHVMAKAHILAYFTWCQLNKSLLTHFLEFNPSADAMVYLLWYLKPKQRFS